MPSSSHLGPVSVGSFFIGRYEVWAAEWNRVRSWALVNGYQIDQGAASGGGHPIRNVSWYDVAKWCNAKSEMEGLEPAYLLEGAIFKTGNLTNNQSPQERLNVTRNHTANGYRLPTQAEWEWAARGGVFSQNYTYSGGNNLDEVAWHYGNSSGAEPYWAADLIYSNQYPDNRGTWPVGQKFPNELGLYDMTGNVWEWCDDLLSYTYENWMPGGGLVTYYSRPIRGGSFASKDTQPWSEVPMLSVRNNWGDSIESQINHEFGFRIIYPVGE